MSADWSRGYVTDTLYTDSFFRELAPSWLNYVAALGGTTPIPLNRPFTYLELGCGMGRSTAVLAAANPNGRFVGIDFNPAHIAHARQYAEKYDIANVEYIESSFVGADIDCLPLCDFVVLHGVYSWVDAEARKGIRDILKRRVKPGGLVYISYNALPGWSSNAPLRKLMVEIARNAGRESINGVGHAVNVLRNVANEKFRYFGATPGAIEEVKAIGKRNHNYLAHEFLNAEWMPFYGVEVADDLAEAKLSYLGSATLPENHLDILLEDESHSAVMAEKSPRLRSLLTDFAINQRFRRDVFVRGNMSLNPSQRAATIQSVILSPAVPESEFSRVFRCGRKQVSIPERGYEALKALAYKQPALWQDLAADLVKNSIEPQTAQRILHLLVAAGKMEPCASLPQRANKKTASKQTLSDRSRMMLESALADRSRQYLPSEISGSGVSVEVSDAAMTLLMARDGAQAGNAGSQLQQILSHNGIRLNPQPDDKGQVPGEDEFAKQTAERFVANKLPQLVGAGILPSATLEG
jgi:SAM-dependent methyltransferase